ncbi:MAG: dipeptidase [Bacteroidales bacterium]|nr:dipeptidase [Bacteroidales bacterium]
MFVLDSHCDTPSQIMRLRDISIDNPYAHVDIPKLKRGGVDGVFFALYVPASLDGDPAAARKYAYGLLEGVRKSLSEDSEAVITLDPQQALTNKANGLVSIFLGLENGSPIISLDDLQGFHNAGIRYITLCHTGNNHICDSCATQVKRWNGLSPFGRELLSEMNRIGMIADVSHISDEAFYDVIEFSDKPVVATHSCCRALADHPRNLTDDMIRCIAEKDGVVQVNFYPVFLDSGFRAVLSASGIEDRGETVENAFIADPSDLAKREAWYAVLDELSALKRPSYKRIVDHIDHIANLVGIDYVGFGSDFDGIAVTPEGLENISGYGLILAEMRARGYSEQEIGKIASGNFFRVMKACQ